MTTRTGVGGGVEAGSGEAGSRIGAARSAFAPRGRAHGARLRAEILRGSAVIAAMVPLVACSGGDGAREATGVTPREVELRFEARDERIVAEAAPGGAWSIAVQYPQIVAGPSPATIAAVNDAILREVAATACDGPGEHTFAADVVRNDGILLSVRYEAKWRCASIPSPGASAGGMSFELRSGESIALADELSDSPAIRAALEQRVADAALATARALRGDDAAFCGAFVGLRGAYITGDAAVFTQVFEASEPACDVEIPVPLRELRPFLHADSPLRDIL